MRKLFKRSSTYFLMILLGAGMSSHATALYAALQDEPPKEPIWVMSWAFFIFFIAMTTALLSRSVIRPDTLLNHEEQKKIDESKSGKKKKGH